MIIFQSLKCFAVYFSMEFLFRYLKTFPLKWARVQIRTQWGVYCMLTCAYDGGGGQIDVILVRTY